MIRETRHAKVAAHLRALPSRYTSVHAELAAARAREILQMADLESKLALALAADFERMEGGYVKGDG